MNAHVLAVEATREPADDSVEAWVEFCATVNLAHSALIAAVRPEVG